MSTQNPRSEIYDTSTLPSLEELLQEPDDLDLLLSDPELAALLDAKAEDTVPALETKPVEKAAEKAPKKKQAPPKKKPAEKKPFNGKQLLMLLAILAIVLLDLTFFYTRYKAAKDPYGSRILDVTAAGVNLSGMTKKEAAAALKEAAGNTYSTQDLVVELPDTTLTLSPKDSHASLNVKAAVKAAFAYGRESEPEKGTYVLDVLPYLGVSENYIRSVVDGYADHFDSVYTPSGYSLNGEQPALNGAEYQASAPCQTLNLYTGTSGLAISMDGLCEDICSAYNSNTFRIDRKDLEPVQDPEPLDLEAILNELTIAPSNPSIDKETLKLVPGSYGYTFDPEVAEARLSQAAPGETVPVPMFCVAPEISEEDAWFQDIMGYAITPHGNNEKRTENLRKACGILNGMVIQPGQEISYNEILGERTKENGWLPAPAYSGTELKDSPGGGICQVSSTLYLASVFAEMEILDRTNHGYPVTYIPIGLDATVNWGLTDLKLKNSSKLPVKILAEESDDSVKIRVMGTDTRDYYIGIIYGSYDRFATAVICKYDLKTNELISKESGRRSAYLDEVTSYRGEIFSAERNTKK